MSLAKIKAKETKGKQKVLSKLKTILANPNKTRCPILDEKEMEHLKNILQGAIQDSQLQPRCFATKKGICLGLESSLRKINNKTSSCVFISLSIKPSHIIGLIARNAETKDETQPVYAQPQLEHFTEEIFGVRALCLVFPKDLLPISAKINKWVEERKKRANIRKDQAEVKQTIKKKLKKPKLEQADRISFKEEFQPINQVKSLSVDFISFGEDHLRTDNSKLDNEAVDALSDIMNKIPTSTVKISKIPQKCELMEVDADQTFKITNKYPLTEKIEDSDYSDDFLSEYKNLNVHKIKGNPNKNPKRKRKNKKKKPEK